MKIQKMKILNLRMALLAILLSGLSMQGIYAFSEVLRYSRYGKAGWQVTEGCSPSFWL